MNIGIVGLGLIGGSIAKAIKQNTEYTVYGIDIQESVVYKAKLLEAIDGPLTADALAICDIVILALYPKDTIGYLREHGGQLKEKALVIDTCGVKEAILVEALPIAEEYGFQFIGAHPMAGIEFSGFEYSQKLLFKNASMILTPPTGTSIEVVDMVKRFWLNLGFTNVEITSPKKHDELIAFTSQLAHVVSSAYVKSPSALEHKGFSAGSYKDMTRVAKLNADMWTELFLLNSDHLVEEIDGLIERLGYYRDAIADGDEKSLRALLKAGTERKIALDFIKT
jgi:prephenate dehydrogenase